MSNQSSCNHGGASIRPSARPSIHNYDHGYCPFARGESMGRYGVRNRHLGSESLQESTDEVDNVLSKPLSTSSPIRPKVTVRRNSYNIDNSHELLSEDNFLSKSLPANFQSHYSDDFNNDLFEEMRHEQYNVSNSTLSSTEHRTPLSIQQDLNETKQFDENNCQSNGFHIKYWFLPLLIGIYCIYYALQTKAKIDVYDKITFTRDLHMLGVKYNVAGDSILKVLSGIDTIIDRGDTGSFIFVYNSKTSNFKEYIFNNFLNDIASAAAKLLRNDTAKVQHIVLESGDLKMRSHNEFMSAYRHEVDKTGVMLVKKLENIPSNLAMAFHYYCDEYNPLVKKSAIFFTLDLGNCFSYSEERTSNAVIEKCLSNKWDNVPQANILPLLTRVVGVVVDVRRMF